MINLSLNLNNANVFPLTFLKGTLGVAHIIPNSLRIWDNCNIPTYIARSLDSPVDEAVYQSAVLWSWWYHNKFTVGEKRYRGADIERTQIGYYRLSIHRSPRVISDGRRRVSCSRDVYYLANCKLKIIIVIHSCAEDSDTALAGDEELREQSCAAAARAGGGRGPPPELFDLDGCGVPEKIRGRSGRSFSARDPLAGTCSRDDTSSSHERDSRGRVIPRATPLLPWVDAAVMRGDRSGSARTWRWSGPSFEFNFFSLLPRALQTTECWRNDR